MLRYEGDAGVERLTALCAEQRLAKQKWPQWLGVLEEMPKTPQENSGRYSDRNCKPTLLTQLGNRSGDDNSERFQSYPNRLRDFSRGRPRVLERCAVARAVRAGQRTTSVFSDFEAGRKWQSILHAKGWGAPEWPIEHGGTGWDIQQRYIFLEECKLANAPNPVMMGIQMLGPMLIHFGTEAQKQQFLPGIISGDDVWCQGYSEPGSGSTLHRSRPLQNAMAMNMSSTAPRSGPAWRTIQLDFLSGANR